MLLASKQNWSTEFSKRLFLSLFFFQARAGRETPDGGGTYSPAAAIPAACGRFPVETERRNCACLSRAAVEGEGELTLLCKCVVHV